ncbi:polysaccharide deacetylase family protein [Pontibacter kalidii]|uniref:polysaccharide deacetylase family protein n=1 Tax=Pontibacter kalidii TaxID=2592049 RepID=UPI002258D223|nr:polysaccharide deacetylase family protein [Pontibacter kalidii]
MIRSLTHTLKRYLRPRGLVLMYHRVAQVESDVWRLAVSPHHFEQHLQMLHTKWRVIPLAELADDLVRQKVKRNSVAITFDDGYADNFLVARPLLVQYRLPATFFICSGNIGSKKAFWWDELEHLILSSKDLPAKLNLHVAHTAISFDLGIEGHLTEAMQEQHRHWKAYVQAPPTARASLFLQLWEALRPLPSQQQQHYLQQLKAWAGASLQKESTYSMDTAQLEELARHELFTLGAHTVSHPDLACLPAAAQQQEMLESKAFLERCAATTVSLLAYPYGSYTQNTASLAAKAGFKAAVTTSNCPVKHGTPGYGVGRFLVDDWSGRQLDQLMSTWINA